MSDIKADIALSVIADALQNPRKLCEGPKNGGCACTGHCLQRALACLRYLYDQAMGIEGPQVWSDQLHGLLVAAPGEYNVFDVTPDRVKPDLG